MIVSPEPHCVYGIFLTRFHNFCSIFWFLELFHSSLWNSVLFSLKTPKSSVIKSSSSPSTGLPSGSSTWSWESEGLTLSVSSQPVSFKHQPLGTWAGLRKDGKSLGLLIRLNKAARLWMLLFWWLTLTGHWMPCMGQASKYWLPLGHMGCSKWPAGLFLPSSLVGICLLFLPSTTTPTSALPRVHPAVSFCWGQLALWTDSQIGYQQDQTQTTIVSAVHFLSWKFQALDRVCPNRRIPGRTTSSQLAILMMGVDWNRKIRIVFMPYEKQTVLVTDCVSSCVWWSLPSALVSLVRVRERPRLSPNSRNSPGINRHVDSWEPTNDHSRLTGWESGWLESQTCFWTAGVSTLYTQTSVCKPRL